MFPRLGPLPFPTTYGLLVALGLVLALMLARRLAAERGLSPLVVQDVLIWACLAGILGAKVVLVALEPRTFLNAPWEVLFQGGVFYGGALAAAVTAGVLARRRGITAHALGDVCAAALPLGHAFGRLGCFLAGCCWGSACDAPWAVTYSHAEAAATHGIFPPGTGVHPVQLYEAAGNLVLCAAMLLLLRHLRFTGQAWWTYVAGYALLRWTTEAFRGDPRGSWLGGALSTSRLVALAAFAAALAMLAIRARAARRERALSEPSADPPPPATGAEPPTAGP